MNMYHFLRCKSCAKFSRKLDHLAAQHADIVDKNHGHVRNHGAIRIVNVEYGAAMELCRSLHVKQLPTVHLYQNGRRVQDFVCPPSQFHRLEDLTEFYVNLQSKKESLLQTQTHTTNSNQQSNEELFEATINQGRNMIQGKLREEELAKVVLQENSSQVPDAPSVHDPALLAVANTAGGDRKITTGSSKLRFWDRFRRDKQ